MKNSLTNFDALWSDASQTLHTLCRETWTSQSEADPGIMLLQAMAYKVLGIHYQREHLESTAYHFNPALVPEKALTTTPISADDYRRIFLDAVDENGYYLFRDIQIDKSGKEGQFKVIYVPDDLFSNADKNVFENKIFDIFAKNRGVGELLPDVVAAKAVDVEFAFSVDAHADQRGHGGGLNREYNLVLAAIDRALRPPPGRDAIVDASILEGPEVAYPNITEFRDAIKMVGRNVYVVCDEWNLVELSRLKKSHEDIVKERLAAAKEAIEGFSFVHHFAVTSTTVKVTAPSDAVNGDYFYYSIRKGKSIDEVGLAPTFAKQNDGVQKISPTDWRVAPLSKANNKIFHVRDNGASPETGGTIPTLLQMMPPAYREEFGGAQWKELVSVFDGLLKTVEDRDKEVVSFFEELTPGKSSEEADLSFVDWLLRRVGGDDISSVFNYHLPHTDLDKRAAAHHVELRRFLPAILNTMQSRNLARYPKPPLSTLLWFAVGEGWSGWRDLKVTVLDHSHFINGAVGQAPSFLDPLSVDIVTNFSSLYAVPEPAIKQFVSIVREVIPMHLSWNVVDIKDPSYYAEIDAEYRIQAEKYNANEGFSKVYKEYPAKLQILLTDPPQDKGVKRYSQNGQLRY